ncbi:hypothetical protein FCM35_KLT16578 [Carex littledalei]|uniref:Uncharacterized protein n=1 Tax=Carex littledalei TaxID=544730 RepID=A0A833RD36_9POAL|nr:hypothetical protein FCM35_KLT16578 [Carex littledalei]
MATLFSSSTQPVITHWIFTIRSSGLLHNQLLGSGLAALELKDLRTQLHQAADYCVDPFLKEEKKKISKVWYQSLCTSPMNSYELKNNGSGKQKVADDDENGVQKLAEIYESDELDL